MGKFNGQLKTINNNFFVPLDESYSEWLSGDDDVQTKWSDLSEEWEAIIQIRFWCPLFFAGTVSCLSQSLLQQWNVLGLSPTIQ